MSDIDEYTKNVHARQGGGSEKMEVCLKIFCCGEKGETRKNAMSYSLGLMIMKAPMTMIEWWLSPMKFCNAFSLMQNIKNNP